MTSAELEKFQCQLCTVTYNKKFHLDQHMKFHQNTAIPVTEQFENEMPCQFCHLTFKLKFDLEKHTAKCQKYYTTRVKFRAPKTKSLKVPVEQNAKIQKCYTTGVKFTPKRNFKYP